MTDHTPAPRSIALTTPFLSLAAGLIALAAFLLGYVVKDLCHDDHPRMGHVMIERGGPMGPAGRMHENRLDGGPQGGTVQSINGSTVTLKTPDGKTSTVKLGKGTFIVVRKAPNP